MQGSNSQIEITICLGSSCFSRGNRKIVHAIEGFLASHNLKEKVFFHGAHCFSNCANGPIMKMNEDVFENINEMNVIEILSKKLLNA